MSYSTVMVPLDGSSLARGALPVARAVGRRSGAELLLVGVHAGLPRAPSGEPPEALARADREQARRELEELEAEAEGLRDQGLAARAEQLEGPVVASLCRYAEERAELVVMATHGRGGFSRFWLGSVADGLMHRCSAPMLVVPPRRADGAAGEAGGAGAGEDAGAREPGGEAGGAEAAGASGGGGEEPAFRHLLVPLDGSPLSEEILDPALELGRLYGARYTLLRVAVPVMATGFGYADFPQGVDPASMEALEEGASAYLEKVAGRMREEGLEVSVEVRRHPSPATVVREVAQEVDAELVAMATHGRGGLGRLLLGSVTDKVVRTSALPVLLQRPRDRES